MVLGSLLGIRYHGVDFLVVVTEEDGGSTVAQPVGVRNTVCYAQFGLVLRNNYLDILGLNRDTKLYSQCEYTLPKLVM